jgi:hypothetical protein
MNRLAADPDQPMQRGPGRNQCPGRQVTPAGHLTGSRRWSTQWGAPPHILVRDFA